MSYPGAPAPGWYQDPTQAGIERWWDGQAWSQETRVAAPPPPPPPFGHVTGPKPQALAKPTPQKSGCLGVAAGVMFGIVGAVVLLFAGCTALIVAGSESDDAPLQDAAGSSNAASPLIVDRVGAEDDPPNPGVVYADRLGAESEDREATIGTGVAVDGWNIYIDDASTEGGRLTITGRLFNRTEKARSYISAEWGLQLPSGELVGSLILSSDATSTVASGGEASVSLVFKVEEVQSKSWVYLVYDPVSLFEDPRAVWGIEIP